MNEYVVTIKAADYVELCRMVGTMQGMLMGLAVPEHAKELLTRVLEYELPPVTVDKRDCDAI